MRSVKKDELLHLFRFGTDAVGTKSSRIGKETE